MPGTSSSGGRNRKSKATHALAGTGRKDRGTATTGTPPPDPPKGRPPTPKTLRGEALAEWGRMVHRLDLAHTLSIVDDAVLARYCRLHARANRLERALARERSAFYIDNWGNPKVHPAFAQLRAYDQALRGYLVEFGMTPAARTRVTAVAEAPTPADPFAEFDEPPHQAH